MPKRKIISKKQTNVVSFFKQLLKADFRLTIYPGFLAGKFVWMRPMFPKDYYTMEDCFTDSINVEYFGTGKVWSRAQIESTFYKCAHKNLLEPNVSTWSIISHQGLAGCFFLTRMKDEGISENKEKEETAEIAYCLRRSFSGRGYTTEAGQLVIDAVAPSFNGLFFATVHPKNKGSQRVLEKIGLKPDNSKQNVLVEKYNAPRNFYQLPNRT